MSLPPANADHPRRRSIAGPAVFTLISVFSLLLALHAGAAPLWKAALTSSDAGQTNRVALGGNQTYEILCLGTTPGCWRVGDAGVAVDCAKDQPYPLVRADHTTPTAVRELPVRFATFSGAPYVAALAYDGGNPNCQVYTMVGGANATGGALPLGPITPR